MTLEFLSAEAGAGVARSPMEREALAAGARMELRDGWNVAVDYGNVEAERAALRDGVGFADSSHLGKLELNAPLDELAEVAGKPLELGRAVRSRRAWWCPVAPERALLLCEPPLLREFREELSGVAIEVTTSYAALTIAGPAARELFARFCAIDLRPQVTPVGGFRPGSVARTPGYVLREDDDRFLMLFGWALGRYLWETVSDAAAGLGGRPVGLEALGAGDA